MKKSPIQCDYTVHHISEGKSRGYKAIIPAFHGIVFGDNFTELEKGVALALEEEKNTEKSS